MGIEMGRYAFKMFHPPLLNYVLHHHIALSHSHLSIRRLRSHA